MIQTIQKSSSGATFTVTDVNGIAQSYVCNDYLPYIYPGTSNVTLYNKANPSFDSTGRVPSNGILFNQPFGNVIDGDTGVAFLNFSSFINYILTNFFRKAGGGGGGSLSASQFVIGEIPGGAINNTNTAFTTAKGIQVILGVIQNGFTLNPNTDYTLNGQGFLMTTAPLNPNQLGSSDVVIINYIST